MKAKDLQCPCCGASVYKVAKRYRWGVCSWGWPWALPPVSKRKPVERKRAA